MCTVGQVWATEGVIMQDVDPVTVVRKLFVQSCYVMFAA